MSGELFFRLGQLGQLGHGRQHHEIAGIVCPNDLPQLCPNPSHSWGRCTAGACPNCPNGAPDLPRDNWGKDHSPIQSLSGFAPTAPIAPTVFRQEARGSYWDLSCTGDRGRGIWLGAQSRIDVTRRLMP